MIEIPEWYNASVLVDRNLEAGRADKVAIYCGDDEVTYGELRRISRFGHALRALGVDREDRVMLMLNDTPSFPTAFFADAHWGRPDPGQHLAPARGLPLLRGEQPRTRRRLRPDAPRDYPEGPRRYDEEPVEVIVTNGRAEGRSFWRTCWKAERMSSTLSRRTGTIRRSGSTAREHWETQRRGPSSPRHHLHLRDLCQARAGGL